MPVGFTRLDWTKTPPGGKPKSDISRKHRLHENMWILELLLCNWDFNSVKNPTTIKLKFPSHKKSCAMMRCCALLVFPLGYAFSKQRKISGFRSFLLDPRLKKTYLPRDRAKYSSLQFILALISWSSPCRQLSSAHSINSSPAPAIHQPTQKSLWLCRRACSEMIGEGWGFCDSQY